MPLADLPSLCTEVPGHVDSQRGLFQFPILDDNLQERGRHCGNKSGREPFSTIGGRLVRFPGKKQWIFSSCNSHYR